MSVTRCEPGPRVRVIGWAIILGGAVPGADRGDLESIAGMGVALDRPRLRKQARKLCFRYRDKIRPVAAALVEHGHLSGEKIDRLLGVQN